MTIFSHIEHILHKYPMKVKFSHKLSYFHTLSIFYTIILLLFVAILFFWNYWLFHGGRCISTELRWPMVFLARSSRWRKEESHQIDQTLPHRRHFWLLLGMQRGAHEEAPTKLYLAHGTFATFMTISTIIACFVERAADLRQHHNQQHPRANRAFVNIMTTYTLIVCFANGDQLDQRFGQRPAGVEVPSRWRSSRRKAPRQWTCVCAWMVGMQIVVNIERL
jgi:hypothetical protein